MVILQRKTTVVCAWVLNDSQRVYITHRRYLPTCLLQASLTFVNSIRYLHIPLRFQQSTYLPIAVILPSEYRHFLTTSYQLILLRSRKHA